MREVVVVPTFGGRPRVPLADRFWARVAVRGADACWEWTATRDKDGYGKIRTGGGGSPTVRSHRVSWELRHGPIPDGLWVLHRCDNPPCVNPAHLFLGTPKDNVQDSVRKLRKAMGERGPRAKLTREKVLWARGAVCVGATIPALARLYGVSGNSLRFAVSGRTWAWLEPGHA